MESDAVHPIRILIEDMGLAEHPGIQDSWQAATTPDALSEPGRHPLGEDRTAPLRALAGDLLALRPARQHELIRHFAPLGVDLLGLRPTFIDMVVGVASSTELRLELPQADLPFRTLAHDADPAEAPALLGPALAQRAAQAGPAESLVLRVDLTDPELDLDAADAIEWERLLWSESRPVLHHLVRVVPRVGPAADPAPRPAPIHRIGFLARADSTTTAPERSAVQAAWPGLLVDDSGHGQLVHIHAHGSAGLVEGLDPQKLSAWAVLVNACQGARSGGLVRRLVQQGGADHAMGFPEDVRASVTETVAHTWHTTLSEGRAELGRSIWRAGAAVRTALGAQPSAWKWRHYACPFPAPP